MSKNCPISQEIRERDTVSPLRLKEKKVLDINTFRRRVPWNRCLGVFQRHSLPSFVQGLPCRSRDQTPEARRHLPTGETHRSKRSFANGVKLHFAAAWTQRTMRTADREAWFVPHPPQSSAPRRGSASVWPRGGFGERTGA